MATRAIEFSLFRFRPGGIDPPRFKSFRVDTEAGTTVLDALERIRSTLDGSLLYRRSCHHGSCGTYACRVNGVERLACRRVCPTGVNPARRIAGLRREIKKSAPLIFRSDYTPPGFGLL